MKQKLKPRVDRFVNIMELAFSADDIGLLYKTFDLLKSGKLTFWEFIKPYLKSCLNDPDLITKHILLNDYLTIRLGYANGKSKLTEGYTVSDLKFILEDFENITSELKDKIGEG